MVASLTPPTNIEDVKVLEKDICQRLTANTDITKGYVMTPLNPEGMLGV